jgi:hypothetical protein
MTDAGDHGKSARNRVTEKAGLVVLLADPRFQAPDTATKKELLKHFGLGEDIAQYGAQSFDAVYSDETLPTLTEGNIGAFAKQLRLVEMKTTKKPIGDSALAGFFFGATEREYALASRLGDRFRFAFVVLNNANTYGRPFARLVSHAELEAMTHAKRVQFQVNLKSKKSGAKAAPGDFVVTAKGPLPGA